MGIAALAGPAALKRWQKQQMCGFGGLIFDAAAVAADATVNCIGEGQQGSWPQGMEAHVMYLWFVKQFMNGLNWLWFRDWRSFHSWSEPCIFRQRFCKSTLRQ